MANDSLDFVQRGKVSIVRRQYAEAVKICRLGLLGQPSLLEGRLVLGMALTALGRWDEVLAEMRVALETDANSALAWLLKGEALVGKGDYVQAEATLKRAKELDPSNTKADQLLAEIATARAAGFEGLPAEPTDTKVYPARQTGNTDPELGNVVKPMPMDRGQLVTVDESEDVTVDVPPPDDATEVDPDPSNRNKLNGDKSADKPASVLVDFGDGEDTVEDSQIGTETFVKPHERRREESSYEGPANDDYAEHPRPRILSPTGPTLAGKKAAGSFDTDEPSEDSTMTPAEVMRAKRPVLGPVRRAVDDLPRDEPSIVLDSGDIMVDPSREGFPRGFAPTFDIEDGEDELTRQRRQKQVDETAGTAPDAPEPVLQRAKPVRPFDPLPRPPSSFPRHPADAPTETREPEGWRPTGAIPATNGAGRPASLYGDGHGHVGPYGANGEEMPGVVRVPVPPKKPPRTTLFVRGEPLPWFGDRPRRSIALLFTALIAVVAVGVATGLLVREWRMRVRVAKRFELAKQKLASGNYTGFQTAALFYQQILAERDDPEARAMRARVLAQMSFEFGDPPQAAEKAVAALNDNEAIPCADKRPGCLDAAQARVYLAMATGELDRATRLATLLRRKFPDAASSYLFGRAELLLERPESAVEALRAAAEADPRNPLVMHGLGLAEAAAHNDDRAFAAYRHALADNANHIATIIDRALLQVRRGIDRAAARGALEGVVVKLNGDASYGQLARAFLGLAELELGRGDVAAARRDLGSAAAKRPEGDALLSEELAQAFADAYELDAAEREARRAIAAASGRMAPRLTLAEVALKRAQPQKALDVITEVGTSRPEALVMRAMAYLMLGRKESARIDVRSALALQPDLVAAKVAQARIDIADGHPERALRTLDAIERGPNKTADVSVALGLVYLQDKTLDRTRARDYFGEALKRDPLDLEARLMLARLEHDAGNFPGALDRLNQVLQTNADYAPAMREKALVELDAGDFQAAREDFDSLLTNEENVDLDTLMNAARACILVHDGAAARERIGRAQKLAAAAGAQEELTDLLARALLVEHKAADAVTLLRKIITTATRGETPALMIEAYLDLDQPERALEMLHISPPRARSSGTEIVVARARLAVERGRDSVAEGFAQEALTRMRGPRPPRALKAEAYTILGRSQYEQGEYRPAIRALHQATALDARAARAWLYLGQVNDDLKRPAEARTALEAAVKADPLLPDAWYYLGRARAQAGEATARDAYQKYLDVAPRGVYAAEVREALKQEGAPATPTSSRPRTRRRGR